MQTESCVSLVCAPTWLELFCAAGQFLMFNGAELKALPAHFANDSVVNGTNYWRMISAGLHPEGFDFSVPFAGPMNGKDGPALSLDETLEVYDKLKNPDYSTAVTIGALMMVVLIVLHNAWLLLWLHLGRAWIKKSTAQDEWNQCERSMNSALNHCGSFCGIGVLIGKVFNLTPPQDVQELVARKSKTESRVSPTNLPEARVVNDTP